MKKIILTFLSIHIISLAFAGGGWTYEKGKGYVKIGQNAIIADNFFNLQGDIIDITTISLYTTSLYAEVGITDKLDAVIYAPLFVRSTLNNVERRQSGKIEEGDEINSFGDTDLSLKYRLLNKDDIVLSAMLTFGLPLGKTAEGLTKAGDPRILQTGDGEFNQLLMLIASHSFYPKPLYLSAGIGYNNRTQGFSDELRWLFEIGYSLGEKTNMALKLYSIHSMKNGDPGGGAGNGVFGNNVEYISFGPDISYKLSDSFGFSVSGGFAVGAKNLLAAPNWGAGVFKTF